MKYNVTIYEKHIVEVDVPSFEDAEHEAERLHEEAGGAYYDNSWVEAVERVAEKQVRRLDPVD